MLVFQNKGYENRLLFFSTYFPPKSFARLVYTLCYDFREKRKGTKVGQTSGSSLQNAKCVILLMQVTRANRKFFTKQNPLSLGSVSFSKFMVFCFNGYKFAFCIIFRMTLSRFALRGNKMPNPN